MPNDKRSQYLLRVGATALLALSLSRVLPLAAASGFANSAFDQQWHAAETTVQNFWGPISTARDGLQEPYRDAPGGQRLVQYFDKARMELTNPAVATVTNGLLTVELISGKRQLGNDSFSAYPPATSPIAGDPTNSFPTYQSLAPVPGKVAQDSAPVSRVFNPDGTFGADTTLGNDPNAAFGSYQGDPGGQYSHTIAKGMWDYLQGLPVGWVSTMGYPITEAFWAKVTVGGVVKPVMMQAFQRRVLTYTPGNPAGFQVEMGNIGQHYSQWRYVTAPDGSNVPVSPTASGTATPTPAPSSPTPSGPAASGAAVTFMAAPNAHPKAASYVTIKTAPGASCTLDYKAPGETTSTRPGKTMTADNDGMVTWSFAAGGTDKNPASKGQAVEIVTCNGASASQTITIG